MINPSTTPSPSKTIVFDLHIVCVLILYPLSVPLTITKACLIGNSIVSVQWMVSVCIFQE